MGSMDSTRTDPYLAYLIDHWPGLSQAVREQIITLARAATEAGQSSPQDPILDKES
jgi:hypothetical protein